ncbi:MAG: M1 family metallopeptidase [Myxococcales bacterium]|nr:M1 family metallopeptidase [Myxococcales bacterium]
MNRLLSSSILCLLFASSAACGSDAKRKVHSPEPAATALATHGIRIERAIVVPERYQAKLRLDPSKETFSGDLEVALSVEESSSDFFMNGHGLTVSKASIKVAEEVIELNVVAEDDMWLHFTAPRALPTGNAMLSVVYEGAVSSESSYGIFRQEAAGDWYLFTQFESRAARRAFPSIDQPDIKVPWQLSLEVPEGLVALANTPESSREPARDGFVRVNFAESPPLPSYLVAFAVGPFDMVDIGKTRSGVPVRVAAPRGRGDETEWVKESTLPLLEILEDYTGIPYPYAKLDLVSIPSTGSFGAMENPGLITYTETLLLSKSNDLDFKKNYANTGAHELAHQWFGNLVTNAWWDDLWLNESFATWASAKAVSKFNPKWRTDTLWAEMRSTAMGADRLFSARIIHQPIVSAGDIGSAFDRITYSKGASVLAMFEGWLGEETFQRGIQHYLSSSRWKSLEAKDFLEAMEVGTGQNISDSFSTFIDNPGTPLVSFDLDCADGKSPTLSLSHERYRPLGSKVSESPDYQIPVCVRYPTGVGKTIARECTLISQRTSKFVLGDAQSCPQWIVPNAGATGYYRSQLSESLLESLLKKAPLTVPEQFATASDLKALVYAGLAPIESMLSLVPTMASSNDDGLQATAAGIADLGWLVTTEARPRYQAWLVRHFGKTTRRLGWTAKAGEPSSRTALRTTLLSLMILEAQDVKLRATGQKLAKAWLSDPTSVDANVAGLALKVGARFGDTASIDAYVVAIKGTSDRNRRRLLLEGIGAVTEPALVQHALKIMLDTDIDARESRRMLSAIADQRESGHLALAFVEKNFAGLATRYGGSMKTRLAGVASSQCDAARNASVETFLREKIAPMEGGKRAAEQALESHRLCLAATKSLRLPTKL